MEFGLVVPQGIRHVYARVPDLIEDAGNELPGRFRLLIQRLLDHLKELDRHVGELEREIEQWHRGSEVSKRLETIPGIGPITASALVASAGDPSNFKNARQFAAWIGLVPHKNSSGGKTQLLEQHHYLGAIPKIGQTLRYVAQYDGAWVAVLSFSASSLKCGVRDQWIGWDARLQYGRLKLIANNSRLLILPDWHQPNLGSKVLALCQRRLPRDWLERFGHPLLLLETFVDPQRFDGTVYRAANWTCVGLTKGFRRTARGYSAQPQTPKQVFVRALHPRARQRLAQPVLDPRDHTEEHPTMTLTAAQMRALPGSFQAVSDPRRAAGRRHPMRAVLAIAAGATLCGMRGYKAIGQWAQALGQKGAQRMGCRRDPDTREYLIPSVSVIREVLMRVDPDSLDRALGAWNALWAARDRSLAIDAKTLRGATDEQGLQVHVMSAVGHESRAAYTQKKSAA